MTLLRDFEFLKFLDGAKKSEIRLAPAIRHVSTYISKSPDQECFSIKWKTRYKYIFIHNLCKTVPLTTVERDAKHAAKSEMFVSVTEVMTED